MTGESGYGGHLARGDWTHIEAMLGPEFIFSLGFEGYLETLVKDISLSLSQEGKQIVY